MVRYPRVDVPDHTAQRTGCLSHAAVELNMNIFKPWQDDGAGKKLTRRTIVGGDALHGTAACYAVDPVSAIG
jgi:hypothetical protein